MNEITETMSRAELVEWIEAMQKKNDLWAKAIAREAAKKKKIRKKAE